MTRADEEHLNTQARMCLKTLFNVSRKSRNCINQMYNISEVSTLIEKRKINLSKQLIYNPSTASYTYSLLSSSNTEYSFISDVGKLISKHNLDILELALDRNYKLKIQNKVVDTHLIMQCKYYINNWHFHENRIAFKSLLEEFIHK